MNALLRNSMLAAAMSLGLSFAGIASAQDTCDPTKEECPPKKGDCSPGFYKNHLSFWVDVFCTEATDPSCSELLAQLTCKGSDADCGRSAAAAFLNAASGCTE
jgi:hypothetical protein